MKIIKKISKKTILVKFNKDDFKKVLTKIKNLPGSKYSPESKSWSIPRNNTSIKVLKDLGFKLPDKLKIKEEKRVKLIIPDEVKDIKEQLFNFQYKGIIKIEKFKGKCLLADAMGLGKTVQSLMWAIKWHPTNLPIIIVCPASLKINWQREIRKWCNKTSQIISGLKEISIEENIIIINYEILNSHRKIIKKIKPKTIIIDECHYIKNGKALRSRATISIAKKCDNIIAISGTPIEGKPREFWSILHLLRPDIFYSSWEYKQRYCDPYHNGFGWNFDGASNIEELHSILKKELMIRRSKDEVMKDLPKKMKSVVAFELTKESLKNYNKIEDEYDDKDSELVYMTMFEKLKQEIIKGKIVSCVEWINNFLESGRKLVIFCTHKYTIDYLMESFGDKIVKLDGRDTQKSRQESIDKFQSDDNIKLFVGNIEAAGVGITLTAASDVAMLEIGWSPGKLEQAEDRVHRIGQTESVHIWYLIASDTIEEDIAEDIIDEKKKVLDGLLDGKETEGNNLLTRCIKRYKIRKNKNLEANDG